MIPFSIYFSLLFIGGIILWLLVESRVSAIFKIIMTTLFCFFTVGVFSGLGSFLGWAAADTQMPETVTIIAAEIKEPNINLNNKGAIYLTLDSVKSKYDDKFFKMLKYESDKNEPRIFRIPYSRNLHEQLNKIVIPKLRQGQKVTGKLKKGQDKSGGQGKQGNSGGTKNQNGGGSESLEQEYKFYNLQPSEIQPKNPPKQLN